MERGGEQNASNNFLLDYYRVIPSSPKSFGLMNLLYLLFSDPMSYSFVFSLHFSSFFPNKTLQTSLHFSLTIPSMVIFKVPFFDFVLCLKHSHGTKMQKTFSNKTLPRWTLTYITNINIKSWLKNLIFALTIKLVVSTR